MYQLFRAEWEKITGNRWTTAFFVWIFPVGVSLFILAAIFAALFSSEFREEVTIGPWDVNFLLPWNVTNTPIARWAVLAFTAFVFAGEYKSGTWKNLTILRPRIMLIMSKFITLAVFVTLAFVLMSVIHGVGVGIVAEIIGRDYGLSTVNDKMGAFLEEYALQMFSALTGTFIMASFAAIAAMITKNNIASIAVAAFINFVEGGLVLVLFALIDWLFNVALYPIYNYLPSYNLLNMTSWIQFGKGINTELGDIVLQAPTLAGSMLIIVFWVVGLTGLTAYFFHRQDITS